MPSGVAEALEACRACFERIGVGWYLFGAQAALVYGTPRMTLDVDVTVDIGDASAAVLIEALPQSGFSFRTDDVAGFVERTRVMPVTYAGIPVDIVLAGPGLEERFLERAQVHLIEGVAVPVASPEDIVVMKILAGRPKDIADIEAIIAAGRDGLDIEYVRSTIRLVEDALDRRDLIESFERCFEAARE